MSINSTLHPYFRRLSGSNDLLLHDADGIAYRFAVKQAHLYCKTDRSLRDGTYDSTKSAYPGGYDTFTDLWNRAEDFTYQFSTIDADGHITIHGEHPQPTASLPSLLLPFHPARVLMVVEQ